jgi:succinate dehydrogenase/fumarate reductase flavoprotein subunit
VNFDGDELELDPNQKVLDALEDRGRREEVSAAVIAVCQTMYEAGRTAAQGQTTLRTLSDIQSRLQEIDLTKAHADTYPGIARQLQEILRLASDLQVRNQQYLAEARRTDLGSE